MTVLPLGDSAVVLTISESVDAVSASRVRRVAGEIERRGLAGVTDVVPVFGRVAIYFDASQAAAFDALRRELEGIVRQVEMLPGSVALVISQDAGLRVLSYWNDQVMCWEQLSAGVLEI